MFDKIKPDNKKILSLYQKMQLIFVCLFVCFCLFPIHTHIYNTHIDKIKKTKTKIHISFKIQCGNLNSGEKRVVVSVSLPQSHNGFRAS